MPLLDPNNTYIQPPSEIQVLKFIKAHGYDEDPETKLIAVSKMVATRLHQPWRAILSVLNRCLTGKDSSWDTVRLPILQILWGIIHSTNLDFTSLIWDEFEWKIVERSSRPSKMSKLLYTRFTKLIMDYILSHNKSIPHRSDSKLHSSQDDHPITKLLSTTNGDYKFRMEVPDAMISDAIKKKEGRRGKGFMCYGNQVANVPNKLKKDIMLRKTRSLTIAEEVVVDLRKGSKASRLKRLRKKKQPIAGEGSSAAHNKYYSSSDTTSDATFYSSSLDKPEGSANETNDADKSDMDLSHDNPHGDDDDVRYGVFMHNKSTATPNFTYFSLTVTSSLLDFIQTLLDETPANELTDFMSHPVYTDAQTTLVVHNPKGNPELTSYISGASEVPLGTHVDVLATKTLMSEMFPNVSSRRAYLLGWVVQLTFIGLMGSSAVIANQVSLLLRWKRRSWRVVIRPKDLILVLDVFFYLIPSFFFSKRAEAELGELIELHANNPRYVVMKDLNQKPFMINFVRASHSAIFPVREKWKNLNLDVSLVAPSAPNVA
ncbi:hypothetical protein Tco_0989945 [Tanacetum coccineum]|uniref:Uncharacterized protein n=1 Tax=Tanacetum coccineum TaxID=301880 RepID=A0ABQ5EV27_9ASTR